MADESGKSVANGILGRLPPWPRKALNNSVIAMEQAYRQRKGLPPLTDAEIEALKAGQPLPWETGGSDSVAAAPAPAAPTPAAATPVPTPVAAVAAARGNANISEEVAKWVAQGKKWAAPRSPKRAASTERQGKLFPDRGICEARGTLQANIYRSGNLTLFRRVRGPIFPAREIS